MHVFLLNSDFFCYPIDMECEASVYFAVAGVLVVLDSGEEPDFNAFFEGCAVFNFWFRFTFVSY